MTFGLRSVIFEFHYLLMGVGYSAAFRGSNTEYRTPNTDMRSTILILPTATSITIAIHFSDPGRTYASSAYRRIRRINFSSSLIASSKRFSLFNLNHKPNLTRFWRPREDLRLLRLAAATAHKLLVLPYCIKQEIQSF